MGARVNIRLMNARLGALAAEIFLKSQISRKNLASQHAVVLKREFGLLIA